MVSSNIEAPTQLHSARQVCRWGLQAGQADSHGAHLIRQPSRLFVNNRHGPAIRKAKQATFEAHTVRYNMCSASKQHLTHLL